MDIKCELCGVFLSDMAVYCDSCKKKLKECKTRMQGGDLLKNYVLVISDQRKIKEEYRETASDWFKRIFNQEPSRVMCRDIALDNRLNALALRGPMETIRGIRIRETRPTMIVLDLPEHSSCFIGELDNTTEGNKYVDWFLNEVYPMLREVHPSVPVVNLQKFGILPSRKEGNDEMP